MTIGERTTTRKRRKVAPAPPYPAAAIPVPYTADAPLRVDEETGRVRVGDSRIAIDAVVYAYNQGESPSAIVENYPALSEQAVYAVIAYYLQRKEAVDAYLNAWEQRADAAERIHRTERDADGFNERLLARARAKGLR